MKRLEILQLLYFSHLEMLIIYSLPLQVVNQDQGNHLNSPMMLPPRANVGHLSIPSHSTEIN